MKRRSFLQSVIAGIFAGKALKATAKEGIDVQDDCPAPKPLNRYDETPIDPSWSNPVRPADGKYLDAEEVKCLKCYRWIKIPKGFYAPGDEIECGCGNRALFVLNAKVKTGD